MNITPPTFPARPLNGGPFPKAPAKSGLWHYEPKYNGWRTLVHIESGAMFNRQGKRLSISAAFTGALRTMRSVLDCEAFKWADCEALERRHTMGQGSLFILDVIPEPDYCGATYLERREWLDINYFKTTPAFTDSTGYSAWSDTMARVPACDQLYLVPSCTDGAALWEECANANIILRAWQTSNGVEHPQDFYEGIVAKRIEARYPIQLRRADEETHLWMKHRWSW